MEEKNTPNYFGILPANVRYDKKLKPMEKICSLKKKLCYLKQTKNIARYTQKIFILEEIILN